MRIYKHTEEIPKQINPTGLKLQPVVGKRDLNFACEFAETVGKGHSYGTRSVPTTLQNSTYRSPCLRISTNSSRMRL